jgi:uncharacterized protein YgbK (DUF1537 family)
VVSTETRLANPNRASAVVRELGIAPAFKKVDSVLRGPVRAELEAAMAVAGKRRALLLPANPSLGRTIRAGQYAIDGVPLDETAFRSDPDYPAHSSSVIELLRRTDGHEFIFSLRLGPLPDSGIVIGDADTLDDIAAWAALLDDDTLAAGGSDFFRALLHREGHAATRSLASMPTGRVLTVSGTVTPAPSDQMSSVMTIGRPLDASRSAEFLRELTLAAAAAIEKDRPDVVRVEGGSTAAALAEQLGWWSFQVEGEAATGVAILAPDAAPEVRFVLKPGSYLWPEQQSTPVVRYPRTVHL